MLKCRLVKTACRFSVCFSTVPCKCGWIEKEYLQDMSRILKVILYQTSESLGHSQWELRRIANQVAMILSQDYSLCTT